MTMYAGRGTWIGVGKESTWGTSVSRANWHPIISESLQETPQHVPIPHLVLSSTSGMHKSWVETISDAGGSFEAEMRYTGMGLLLEALLGTVATTGTGPYVHAFTLGDPRSLPSLTVEMGRGTSGLSEIFPGCVIVKGGFKVSAGDVARFVADIIAKQGADRASAGTPTFGTEDQLLAHQNGQLTWNSVAYDLVSMELSVDNKLARRSKMGSLYTYQPQPTDTRDVRLKLTLEVEDAFYTAFRAGTQADGDITFTGSGNNSLKIDLQNAKVVSLSDPISQVGTIIQTLELQCSSDGTDEGLKVTVTNDDASYDTN